MLNNERNWRNWPVARWCLRRNATLLIALALLGLSVMAGWLDGRERT